MKGVSSRERCRFEILRIALDGKQHRSSEFIKALHPGSFSKNTIYKYRKTLIQEKLLQVDLTEDQKMVFSITDEGKDYVIQKLKRAHYSDVGELLESQRQLKQRIVALRLYETIASLSGEELETFSAKEEYERLKKKQRL